MMRCKPVYTSLSDLKERELPEGWKLPAEHVTDCAVDDNADQVNPVKSEGVQPIHQPKESQAASGFQEPAATVAEGKAHILQKDTTIEKPLAEWILKKDSVSTIEPDSTSDTGSSGNDN